MNVTVMDRKPEAINQSYLGFIDCDVHPFYKSPAEFDAFLPKRWLEHRRTIGGRTRQGLAKASNYPRISPGNGQRMDAWPPDGTHPGSDLPFMQQQLLDLFNVSYGLLAPLVGGAAGERNIEFGSAMATAVNEWQLARWCDPDPRLKAAVQINIEHQEAAIAEIEKRAGDRRLRRCRSRRAVWSRWDAGATGRYWRPVQRTASRSRCISAAAAAIHPPAAAGHRSITRNIRPTYSRCRRLWQVSSARASSNTSPT
jgi:predicted TIM-barrel fold metal-dependent hydrolase